MPIEVFEHNQQHPAVDVKLFIKELKDALKFNQNIKVFFINNPIIKGLVDTNIDLLLILAIESKDKNFFTIPNQSTNQSKYFNNLIIPIQFISNLKDKCIDFPQDSNYAYNILIDGEIEIEINSLAAELYYNTKKYLENIWRNHQLDLKDNKGRVIEFEIKPYPIVWVLSPDIHNYNFKYSNVIYAPKFGFKELEALLKYSYYNAASFTSNRHWSSVRNNNAAYQIIDKHIELLKEQLEKDKKIGSLTKKKIERLNRQYNEDLKIYEKYLSEKEENSSNKSEDDLFSLVFGGEEQQKKIRLSGRVNSEKELHNNLIIISGKAGSGKTFEMMLLIKKCYEEAFINNKRSGYYLTYNKLLREDVRILTNAYQYGESKTRVKTLHQFFWKLANSGLRILTIMTNKRLAQLITIQKTRFSLVKKFIMSKGANININELKSPVEFDSGTREYFMRFIAKIKKKDTNVSQNSLLNKLEEHLVININSIESRLNKNIFIQDYYQVLKYILIARTDPSKLYLELDVENISDEVWAEVVKVKCNDKPEDRYKKTEKDFCTMINRSLRGVRGQGQILFVDEAQDCHPLERDILLSIWEERNIVVCTGGREQLIRHNKECNWQINGYTNKPLHNIITIEKRNKTYRMKPSLVNLCNFIAKEFEISIDLSAHNTNTNDQGRVIIELDDPHYSKLTNRVKDFERVGKENELSNYESILFLTETSALQTVREQDEMIIDSEDNIVISKSQDKISMLSELTEIPSEHLWFHHQLISQQNLDADDSSNESEELELSSDTYRCIFYESCRGLEAWSTVCLDIDLFYQRKYDEELAASYLSDDLFLTEQERRRKYAATWVLMALTRAIDTLYIHVNERNSEFGTILQKYIENS